MSDVLQIVYSYKTSNFSELLEKDFSVYIRNQNFDSLQGIKRFMS